MLLRHSVLPAILLCLLLFTSCIHKDLLVEGRVVNLNVAFDWQKAPDAQPTGMTVLFYRQDDTSAEPIRYDLSGMLGGTVQLPPGLYQAIAYNYDTETILYRGQVQPDALEAYTRISSLEEGTQLSPTRAQMPRAVSTEHEPIILEPDMLWGAVSEPLALTGYEEEQSLVLQPVPRVREITITIHNVPNLQYTGQFGGALSGLASSVWMSTGQVGGDCATQAFPVYVLDETTLQMHFRIFGHCPHRENGVINTHLLTIYAILADGSKWYYTQDITDQMHDLNQNPDDTHIYIELDELPLPKPIVNGSGFQPTLDNWQSIEINVGM